MRATGRDRRSGSARTVPVTPLEDPDHRIGRADLTRWPSWCRPLVRAAERLAARLGPYGVYLLPLAVGAAVFGIGAVSFGEVDEGVRERGDLAALDEPALRLAMSLRTPFLDTAVTGFTDIGGPVLAPILTVLVVAAITVVRRSWTPVLVVVPAAAGSLLTTSVGKRIFGRARPAFADAVPPYEHSPSFPSGHALNAVVIAGAVAYVLLLRRSTARGRAAVVVVAAAYAIGIGLSRVFLGHHWLTDVVAAWALGAAWLAVVITVHRLFLTVRRTHRRV